MPVKNEGPGVHMVVFSVLYNREIWLYMPNRERWTWLIFVYERARWPLGNAEGTSSMDSGEGSHYSWMHMR